MKGKLFSEGHARTRSLSVGVALIAAVSVSAQNFVRNPDFEEPLGPDNWIVEFVNCGPWDFSIAGATTMANKDTVLGSWGGSGSTNYWSKLGGHFAPNYGNGLPEAYFKQVVTNLMPGVQYTVSAWMVQFSRNVDYPARFQVWMESLAGLDGTQSLITPYVTANAYNNAPAWQRYSISNVVASGNGQIEIRLHYKVIQTIAQIWEFRNVNAFYDHVSVTPEGPSNPMPPYQITAIARQNENLLLKWSTLMNNRYHIQVSSDVANPVWSNISWNPKQDTNFHATGSSYTFETNLLSLFSYNPSFDPNAPVFFRISSDPYVP